MARRRRIPALVPDGTRCSRSDEYAVGRRVSSPADRSESEPWRKGGYGSDYRKARREVIERCGGRCQICGAKVAVKHGEVWRMQGGEVHHIKPLCEGGGSDAGNLALLCIPCHRRVDAGRRRSGQ